MTNTDININSIAARLDARRTAPLYQCECGARATHAVHKVEGARVLTAYVCGACKKEWEEAK